MELNGDGTHLWVNGKGETRQNGRMIIIIDDESGRVIDTILTGWKPDHIQLAPNGREIWVFPNGGGAVYVYDAATEAGLTVIELPNAGDPHGPAFVSFDSSGNGTLVADQADFHGGVDPRNGSPLVQQR